LLGWSYTKIPKKPKQNKTKQKKTIKNWCTELNIELSAEDSQMVEKYLKKCSTSLVIR
jgi:dihydroxyacetone kinase-like predicted kinase